MNVGRVHETGVANLWNDDDAKQLTERLAGDGVNEDRALRVYTSRLLGSDPRLVIHGGGNTSVKTRMPDFIGEPVDVLCVKGSGWDLATIEAPGLPAVRLAPLHAVRGRDALSDEDMVRFLRSNLLDPSAPNPSVETLLHAFLPHRFVDHAHAIAVLAISDQPDGEARCRDLYGDRFAWVPYVMPGFELAKVVADAVDASPGVDGVILHKHGIFTFGDSAKQSYDRMIEAVQRAETVLDGASREIAVSSLPGECASAFDVAPIVRGAAATPHTEGEFRHVVARFRTSPAIRSFVDGAELASYASRGVVTPDHNIRIKNRALVVPPPDSGALDVFEQSVRRAAAAYRQEYAEYFEHNHRNAATPKTMLDPSPCVAFVPGVGLFGLGRSVAAADVAADLAEVSVATIGAAERLGRFDALPESDLFDMEYWSLEQAKLGKKTEPPFAGQVVAVTGAGGAIGAATSERFARLGASVALLDRHVAAASEAAKACGPAAIALDCDVTDETSVRTAMDSVVGAFGGLDILVSNAGAAWQGDMADLADDDLRAAFDLNFFAHQRMAKHAVRILRRQATGGCLLFNVSKQALNPGTGFGAYGTSKAAALALMRQYAIEYGREGIRSNAVNADRIRSGLMTDSMIAARARQRGVTEAEYVAGNLLGLEVRASDVAEAFVQLALAKRTTASIATVDGGNIAAAPR